MIQSLRSTKRLLGNRRGAALTEFIIFLPVWGFLFAGIFALAKLNMETTRVQLIANKQIWDKVIPITNYTNVNQHATVGAYATAATEIGVTQGTDSNNPEQALDVAEGLIFGVGGTAGHLGESHARILPYKTAGIAEMDDLTRDPDDIVGNNRPYPKSVINDSAAEALSASGGFAEVLETFLTSSGAVHAAGAGIRYGVVFGKASNDQIKVAGGMTYNAASHYDLLVAPAPLKGVKTKMSFGITRLLAETEDNYSVMMNYGESEWEGGNNGASSPYNTDTSGLDDDIADAESDAEDDRQEQCAQEGNENLPMCQ